MSDKYQMVGALEQVADPEAVLRGCVDWMLDAGIVKYWRDGQLVAGPRADLAVLEGEWATGEGVHVRATPSLFMGTEVPHGTCPNCAAAADFDGGASTWMQLYYTLLDWPSRGDLVQCVKCQVESSVRDWAWRVPGEEGPGARFPSFSLEFMNWSLLRDEFVEELAARYTVPVFRDAWKL